MQEWRRAIGSPGTVILVTALGGILALAVWGLVSAWNLAEGTRMPWQGWLAMALAFLFTLGFGIGLMRLAFFSSRHGFDDAVQNREEPPREG